MPPRRPPFTPIIEALPHLVPFVGPEALERARGRPFRARLGANENSFGPSPRVIETMSAAAAVNWKYSDPENFELRTAIAEHHGLPPESVVIGEGIDGLLGLTCTLFLTPGDAVITTDGAYPTFNFHVAAHGGRLIKIPMRGLREDVPRLIDEAVREKAKVVYVSNPNSPVGSWWSASELQAIIDALPSGILLIIDEAYCDTAPPDAVPAIDIANDQVLRLRTFSKAYGLAGARIGYAAAHPELIAAYEKVRNHYGINRVGQIAAREAILDQTYLKDVVARIARSRDRIAAIATGNGLTAIPSATSFVAIDCGRDGAFAKAVLDGLADRDVFVRKPVAPGIDHLIRISCGSDDELDIFAEALRDTLRALG